MITLEVGNVFTDIEGGLPDDLYTKLEKKLSFRPKGYQFTPSFNRFFRDKQGRPVRRVWDGWKRQCWKNKRRTYFPSGLISLTRDFLDEHSVDYRIVDTRQKPLPTLNLTDSGLYEKRDYQQLVIRRSCEKTRGIIHASTGSGKTIICAGIIKELAVAPFMYFVTSIDLLLQAKERLESAILQNGSNLKVGQIGGGEIVIHDVNVMTVQTAVRALGKQWNTNYKFDKDDSDDKTPIGKHREQIKELLHSAKGVICDECVSGDETVTTRQGLVTMRELNKCIGKDILSFDGNSVVWKKMTHFYSKGKKKTLKIALENGNEIKCTENHPIMTKQGWKPAGQLRHKDQILCCANVNVDKKFASKEEVPVNTLSTSLDIKSENDQQKNGKKPLIKQQKQHRFANANAVNRLSCTQARLSHSSTEKVALNTIDFSMDMTNVHQDGTYDYPNPRNRRYSEHSSETLLSLFLPKEAKTQGSMPIMDCVNLNGQNLNQTFSVDCLQNIENTTMEDIESDPRRSELVFIQKSKEYIMSLFMRTKKELQDNGLIALETSGSHGGCATTDREERIISKCIPKVSQKKKSISSPNGSQKNMDQRQYTSQEDTSPYILKKKQETKLFQRSKSTSQTACDINYAKIRSISSSQEEDVFDITVEDTHCFFANNFLVHNCQHWRADTCQLVTRSLNSAYYLYGCSATPYRDEGDDLLIQACFGKKIAEITASELIKKNWLVKPTIKIVNIKQPKCAFRSWQKIYKDQVTDNDYYNNAVANIANAYIKSGRMVLVLVQQINHGKHLASMIPESIFLSGNSAKKLRESSLRKLRNKYISCIIATVIFDEGVDIKSLDTVILAGQGKSKTRAMQRIGRIIRPDAGKTTATAIDFRIHQKFLLDHAKAREEMYRTEPEYVIEEISLNGC